MCVKVKKNKKKKKEIIYLYKTFSTSNNFDVYNLKFIYVQTVLKLKANHCYNYRSCLFERRLKVKIFLAFLKYVGREF